MAELAMPMPGMAQCELSGPAVSGPDFGSQGYIPNDVACYPPAAATHEDVIADKHVFERTLNQLLHRLGIPYKVCAGLLWSSPAMLTSQPASTMSTESFVRTQEHSGGCDSNPGQAVQVAHPVPRCVPSLQCVAPFLRPAGPKDRWRRD